MIHPACVYLILAAAVSFIAYIQAYCPACLRQTLEHIGKHDRTCEHCGQPIADRIHWSMVIPWACWILAPVFGVLAFGAVKLRASTRVNSDE